MMKNKAVLILLIFLSSCNRENSMFNQIDDFFTNNYASVSLSKYRYLVLINEKGECIECCNSFAKGMADFTKKKDALFLVSSQGNGIDISKYIDQETEENVLLDYGKKFLDLKLINSTAIVFLGDNAIDSIVEITPANVYEQIEAFSK